MIATSIHSLLPPLKQIRRLDLKARSVLVTAGGFEDRAFASAQVLRPKGSARALVLAYKPYNPRNRLIEIISVLKRKRIELDDSSIIEYDRFNPESFSQYLQKGLKNLDAQSVIIDISAMSKLAGLLCLDVCREMNLEVTLFYAEAKTYAPSKTEYEEARRERNLHQPSIQVYTGVHGVIRVSRLSSVAMQGQPTAAIAFMSFNEVLTQALLNVVYPGRLFLINGRPPKLSWREEATAWIHEQLRQEWREEDNPLVTRSGRFKGLPKRVTSTLDYRETVKALLKLYWQLAVDHRILLAPTGSKMQAVGCFFVKALHPDIHIEYPTPNGFLDLYSEGIGRKWRVDFGFLGDKVEELRRIERKQCLGIALDTHILIND